MRRHVLAVAVTGTLLFVLLAASLPVAAHPPEEMTIIYNDRLDILTVSIKHDVKDPNTHYIMKIEIFRNNALVIERMFDSQPRDSYNERFALHANEGDLIMAKACCNIEGCLMREMTVGAGITAEGDQAELIDTMVMVHAGIHITALVVALLAIPGGMHFYRCWKTKTKPKGGRRRHARIGTAAIILWVFGALGGMWIVYMTSGDYLGSIHGWMAFGTIVAAIFAAYAASPNFRKAGFGMRMNAHMPLTMLTITLAVVTMLGGMMTAGMI